MSGGSLTTGPSVWNPESAERAIDALPELVAVGWEDPQALAKKYGGNGPDATLCLEVIEKLGVHPFVDGTCDAVHVNRIEQENHYYRV